MTSESQKATTLPPHTAFLGALFGLVGVGSVGLTIVFRSGLVIPWALLAVAPSALISTMLAPFLLPAGLQRRCFETPSLLPLPCLVAFAVVPIGLIEPVAPLLGWAYCAAALVALYRARRAFASIGGRQWAIGVAIAIATAFYLFGTFNPLGYSSVYSPEIAQAGTLKNDAYYHPAIAHMIMNFGRLSPGYDGLGSIHYHLGSHIWFAALAAIGQSTPPFAYPIGQLVVAIPLLYWSVCIVALILARRAVSSAIAMPLVVLAIALFIDQIGWNTYYVSESYTVSMVVMVGVLPMLLSRSADNRQLLGRLTAALPVSFVLACLKLSVGFLWGVATAYTAVRRYSLWKIATWLLLAGLAGVLLLAFQLFRKHAGGIGGGVQLFYQFKAGYMYDGILASLLIPAATVLLGIWQARRTAGGSLRTAFATGATFPSELVLIVTVVALLPGSIMVLQSGNWWYFVNVPHWIAFPILAALVVGEMPRTLQRNDSWSLVPITALIVAVAGWLAWQAGIKPESTLRAGFQPIMALAKQMVRDSAASARPAAAPPPLGRESWWRVTSSPIFTPEINGVLAATPGARMAALVKAAAAGRIDGFAVYVPPDHRAFWELTPWCATQSLMIPSISGVPMLYGLPPAYRKCTTEFNGFAEFPDAQSREVDDATLCRRATMRGVQRVFVLRSLVEPGRNQLLDCSARAAPERR